MATTSPSNFFDCIFEYAEGLLELRALPSGNRTFLQLSDSAGRESFIKDHARENLYFGCATRDGKGGAKENLVHIPCLWCDLDFKLTSLETFKKNFIGFEVPLTACVESGGGLHLYWKLREALTQADIPAVEAVHRRIVHRLGGDATGCEAARILRIPGTMNHKYPREARLAVLNSNECELSDFDFLPDVPKPVTLPSGNGEAWITEALRGVPAGNRHKAGIRLAGFFLSRCVPVDVIEGILTLWNTKNSPPLPENRLKEISRNITRYEYPNGDRNHGIDLHLD
jgi:hypothetical protein